MGEGLATPGIYTTPFFALEMGTLRKVPDEIHFHEAFQWENRARLVYQTKIKLITVKIVFDTFKTVLDG